MCSECGRIDESGIGEIAACDPSQDTEGSECDECGGSVIIDDYVPPVVATWIVNREHDDTMAALTDLVCDGVDEDDVMQALWDLC